MYLIYAKFILILLLFVIVLLAACIPFWQRYKQRQIHMPYWEALATGIFLGVGLLHMLPDASMSFVQANHSHIMAYGITLLMFCVLLFFEMFVNKRTFLGQYSAGHIADLTIVYVLLALHSFLAGFALGIASHTSILITLAIAIFIHKWLVAFALAIKLHELPLRKALLLYLGFALSTPLGIAAGMLFGHNVIHYQLCEAVLLSATAGTFVYLGSVHYWLARKKECHISLKREIAMILLGVLIITFIVIF